MPGVWKTIKRIFAAPIGFIIMPTASGKHTKSGFWTVAAMAACLLPSLAFAEAATAKRISDALPKLEAIVRDGMARTGVPGLAIAIVHDDAVVFLKGYGVREVGKPEPIDPDTVFQLASLSKPIASTVVAALVGQGLVAWDDPIVKHDPGFELKDPWVTRAVTLSDMFSHRSGLPDHVGDLLEDLGYSREEILFRLRYVTSGGPFRASYAYTNFGLTEAAVAAAKAADKPWEIVSEERLYRPAGMTRTSSRYSDFLAADNRAVNSIRTDGNWLPGPPRDPDAQSPAGGVSSTARDLAQWLRLQLAGGRLDGKQIVGSAALAQTHQPVIARGAAQDLAAGRLTPFYGLGWNVDVDAKGRLHLSHSGAFNLGAGTNVHLVPAERLGIVVLTNGYPVGLAEAVSKSFLDLVFDGKIERDWVDAYGQLFADVMKPDYGDAINAAVPLSQPSPALLFASYLGAYDNDFYGALEIADENGSLIMKLGPHKEAFPLQHIDRDTFIYQPIGENAFGPSAVTFTVEADRATAITIENLNLHGQGAFLRYSHKP
ncbi:serine hydrolase [Mesorhizobium sp. LjRoot246]|uniref:serine hydrolase n=1 Tax=Mesorhizobium sp. LjRoot246 TaxID=3342294 RepID=UPI003ECCB24E